MRQHPPRRQAVANQAGIPKLEYLVGGPFVGQ
jgi:hypothetical protein